MPSRWVHEHRFPDREALAAALAGEIKVDLEEAIAARGAASLVVSGGRIACHRRPGPDRLVVGMCVDEDHSAP